MKWTDISDCDKPYKRRKREKCIKRAIWSYTDKYITYRTMKRRYG